MDHTSSGRQIADMARRPKKPVNLTAASEPMSREQACKAIAVSGPSETVALDVDGVSHTEIGCVNNGSRESVYVVVSGFGILCSDGLDMECTAGDVLFVPQGCPHRFERLGSNIRIWSISRVLP
jgi:mannose-6-phosphate isomerase-like protein (cupin superfamily)